MGDCNSALEYIITCSQPALESTELARLERASRLRKELRQILEEWIEAEVEARVARLFLEMRRGRLPQMAQLAPGSAAASLLEGFEDTAPNAARCFLSGSSAAAAGKNPSAPPAAGDAPRALAAPAHFSRGNIRPRTARPGVLIALADSVTSRAPENSSEARADSLLRASEGQARLANVLAPRPLAQTPLRQPPRLAPAPALLCGQHAPPTDARSLRPRPPQRADALPRRSPLARAAQGF